VVIWIEDRRAKPGRKFGFFKLEGIRYWRAHSGAGHALGKHAEGFTIPARVTADLAIVEDQGKCVGQHANHGQQHERRALVHGRLLEMAIGGDDLKDFGIDALATTTQSMNEVGRDTAEFAIGG
jgi:hypothetical protein